MQHLIRKRANISELVTSFGLTHSASQVAITLFLDNLSEVMEADMRNLALECDKYRQINVHLLKRLELLGAAEVAGISAE